MAARLAGAGGEEEVIAQAGPATANALLTAFVTLGVVGTLWGMFKHPKLAFSSLVVVLGALYVGWAAAHWPSVTRSDGLVVAVWEMWLGSVRTIWDTVWDAWGLDSFADKIGVGGWTWGR
jgi:hypothetical protein